LKKLYVDMDGVLTDFFAHYNRTFTDYKINRYGMSDPRSMEVIYDNYDFWSSLPPLGEALSFWKNILPYKPTILSHPLDDECARAKRYWCDKHLSGSYEVILEKEKWIYSNSNAILIDDWDRYTIPWDKHGGQSFLFREDFDAAFNFIKTNVYNSI